MANTTDWLNISSQSGSSGQTILTLSANRNFSQSAKTATITAYNPVYNISARTYVTIDQYSPTISISPTVVGVPASGGTYELAISANCAWVISFPDIVSNYSTSAGTGNAVITFTVPSTLADTTLVGNIVVTDESGQVSRTCRVEQYGAGAHIGYWPGQVYLQSTGGSTTFTVTADCVYSISIASGSFFTVSPQTGYTGTSVFTVTAIGANTGYTDFEGTIVIDGPGSAGGVVEVKQLQPERRLVVGYYVTSTTDPTVLMYSGALSSVSQMEYPDGTQITPATAYTFPSTGMQYVYYTLTGGTIPQNMFNGTEAYMNNKETIREVYVPEGVTSIAYSAFRDCFGLTAVTLPDGLLTVGEDAFRGCIALPDITFPEGLLHIGIRAFDSDSELHTIVIPSSVTGIGSYAFTATTVNTYYFSSSTPPTLGTDALLSDDLEHIIVPCVYYNAYVSAWPQYEQYLSCQDDARLYYITDTSNIAGTGETRTITILNNNINPNTIGLSFPYGTYTVSGNTIYVTYPENPNDTERTYYITIYARTVNNVSLSASYTIAQNGLNTAVIPFTADTSIVAASGETRTITIDATGLIESSITIGIEGATGVTYTYNNGVITIVFPENTGSPRDIRVSINARTTGGDRASTTIMFRQEGSIPEAYMDFTYLVTSTTEPTQIMYEGGIQRTRVGFTSSFIGKAEYNGEEITLSTAYTFPTTGLQTVRFYLSSDDTYDPYSPSYGRTEDEPSSALNDYIGRVVPRFQFMNCQALVRAVFSDSVLTVTPSVFSNCQNLETIVFGAGLRNLYNDVFDYANNHKIVSITFYSPTGPKYNMTGGSMTNYNLGLHIVNPTPQGVWPVWYYPSGWTITEITRWEDQISTRHIPLPDGRAAKVSVTYNVTTVGDVKVLNRAAGYSFMELPSGEIVNIEGVTSAYYQPFLQTGLQTITFTLTGKTMGPNDFKELPQVVNASLGNYCENVDGFQGCTALTGVVLSNTVSTIEASCFKDCTALSFLRLTTGLTSIGDYAFQGCTSLANLTLPNSVSALPYSCFRGCSSLVDLVIPGSVSAINGYCFCGCSSLTGVTFPNSQIIMSLIHLFDGCSSLTSITIPNNIVNEGSVPDLDYTFNGCTNLTSVSFGNGITYIGSYCFRNCSSLETVTWGSGVTRLGQYLFDGAPSMRLIKSYAPTAPSGDGYTVSGLPPYVGTFEYPSSGDYSLMDTSGSWLYYLKNSWQWTMSPTL